MHSTKADKGVMVDKRAQDMSDAIAQRLAAASQPPTGDGGSSSTAEVDETQLFLDIEGVNKKRRVYGLGSATSAYVDTTTSSRARTRSTQSHRTEEEIERRVQAGIQDGLRQITTEPNKPLDPLDLRKTINYNKILKKNFNIFWFMDHKQNRIFEESEKFSLTLSSYHRCIEIRRIVLLLVCLLKSAKINLFMDYTNSSQRIW
ncbi:uncharacterized protein LOC130015700 [Mercurialis annua]|uniref:uncharacterized protein LOC130015700 n=1 Tax=Mercurialis annua TaxID=3986 RepID=UPI0024AD1B6C|nr:uncharacterized protein LOC130015700 [Mercurialis annua]